MCVSAIVSVRKKRRCAKNDGIPAHRSLENDDFKNNIIPVELF